MINVTPEAIQAIRLFLQEKGAEQPIRIHLHSTGCCDASLGLMLDNARADEAVQDIGGIAFLVDPDIVSLTGDITIACSTDPQGAGFILTSERPISEWSGFGVCRIAVAGSGQLPKR